MGRLTYTNSENREVSVPIDANSPVATIGRSADCTISMNFASISRQHAQVYYDPARGKCAVCDLGSANGVLVNGIHVQAQDLADGDDLMLGGFRLHFHEEQQANVLTDPGASQAPAQTEPPLYDEATFVFENPSETMPGGPYGAPVVTPPSGGNGSTQPTSMSAQQPTYQADQLQNRIAELEAGVEHLRRSLATVEAERDQLRQSRGLEQQQIASLRQDLQSATTLAHELATTLFRAGKVLDPTTSS